MFNSLSSRTSSDQWYSCALYYFRWTVANDETVPRAQAVQHILDLSELDARTNHELERRVIQLERALHDSRSAHQLATDTHKADLATMRKQLSVLSYPVSSSSLAAVFIYS